MKVRELMDYLLDFASMDDEVLVTKGDWDDFDEYNAESADMIECCANKGCIHLFAVFEEDETE